MIQVCPFPLSIHWDGINSRDWPYKWYLLVRFQSVHSVPWYSGMGWTVGTGHSKFDTLVRSQSVRSHHYGPKIANGTFWYDTSLSILSHNTVRQDGKVDMAQVMRHLGMIPSILQCDRMDSIENGMTPVHPCLPMVRIQLHGHNGTIPVCLFLPMDTVGWMVWAMPKFHIATQ